MKPNNKKIFTKVSETFNDFFRSSTSGVILLLVSTAIALLWANSSWSDAYFALWEEHLFLGVGNAVLSKTLLHWINDGLMIIFFFC